MTTPPAVGPEVTPPAAGPEVTPPAAGPEVAPLAAMPDVTPPAAMSDVTPLAAMSDVTPLAAMRDLRYDFAGRHALLGISADIRPGLITGLVGPDGAGKTTLLRLLAGLLKPDSGHVEVFGHDMSRNATAAHPLIGYMPQRFGLYEDLTVAENLDLFADLHGLDAATRKDHAGRLLGFTGLAPFTTRLAGQLSGGMKQKLGLACALLARPRLLLLDQPSVGVDPPRPGTVGDRFINAGGGAGGRHGCGLGDGLPG